MKRVATALGVGLACLTQGCLLFGHIDDVVGTPYDDADSATSETSVDSGDDVGEVSDSSIGDDSDSSTTPDSTTTPDSAADTVSLDSASDSVSDVPSDSTSDALVCAPGTASCVGTTLHQCKSDGGGYSDTVCPIACVGSGCITAIGIGVGDDWACAVRSDQKVYCWGHNQDNQFGFGAGVASVSKPTEVAALEPAIAISGQTANGCVITTSHTLRCWGDNKDGQMGTGATGSTHQPATDVPGLTSVTAVSVGDYTICAIAGTNNSVFCWGDERSGATGAGGATTYTATPLEVGVTNAVAVSVVGFSNACATTTSGQLYCWGKGYLGNGSVTTSPVGPTLISGSINLTSFAQHSRSGSRCGLTPGGSVFCWGDNALGICGTGSVSTQLTPVSILTGAIQIGTAGSNGTDATGKLCARTSSGSYCWGPDAPASSSSPHLDSSVSGFTATSASSGDNLGYEVGCFISGGAVFCASADNSYGQLGDGTVIAHSAAAAVVWP